MGISIALTSASNTVLAGFLGVCRALVCGQCLSDAGYHSSSACSHTVEALTVTLPGRHLSCLTTEEEWGLGPEEGDEQGWRKVTAHSFISLFHLPLPGPKELKHLRMSLRFPPLLPPQRAKVQGVERRSCRMTPPHPFYHLKPQVQC